MVSSLLNKLATYTNLSQGVVEHEEDEDSRRREAKVPPPALRLAPCRLVPACPRPCDRWPQAALAASGQDSLGRQGRPAFPSRGAFAPLVPPLAPRAWPPRGWSGCALCPPVLRRLSRCHPEGRGVACFPLPQSPAGLPSALSSPLSPLPSTFALCPPPSVPAPAPCPPCCLAATAPSLMAFSRSRIT